MKFKKERKGLYFSIMVLAFGVITFFHSKPLYAEDMEKHIKVFTQMETDGQNYMPGVKAIEDSDQLFEEYLEKVSALRGSKTSIKNATGNKLTGIDKAIYTKLTDYITQVASGELASTIFEITVEELGLEQLFWTASELGVDSIMADGGISAEAYAAILKKGEYDFQRIIQNLLVDNPYSLYWFDKTVSTVASPLNLSACFDDEKDEYVIGFTGSIFISFPVIEEYSEGEYTFNTQIGQSVQEIVDKANTIVNKYSTYTDYEKLDGYRREICELVSYNQEAAAAEDIRYGNPWQLIWVFDEYDDTNVVCEGYAKAFQYLCNLTDFSGDISCITVSGTMVGGTGEGPHMWNIVTMEDGKNYMVDVTNCDDGTIGAPSRLFLAGMNNTGNIYSIDIDGVSISYKYDDTTKLLFDESEILLETVAYELTDPTIPHIHIWSEWTAVKEPTCVISGSKERTCSVCRQKETQSLPATGHHPAPSVKENLKNPSYEAPGSFDEVVYCSICRSEISRRTVSTPKLEAKEIVKIANSLKVTPVTKKLKAAKVKKKAQSFNIKVTQAQGKITYKSSNKKVKVTAKGKVTIKKGTKKGKYKITVTAAGNEKFTKGVKIVTVIVK